MENITKTQNNMCPVCAEAFNDNDVAVEFFEFDKGTSKKPRLAHVDCIMYISKKENRKHPNTQN